MAKTLKVISFVPSTCKLSAVLCIMLLFPNMSSAAQVVKDSPTDSKASVNNQMNKTALFGASMIDDRQTEVESWGNPSGFDLSSLFGTYQIEKVRSCSEDVKAELSAWAEKNTVLILVIEDEPDRFILHGKIPGKIGFFEFIHRVYTKPSKSIITGYFVEPSGITQSVSSKSDEIVKQFNLIRLMDRLRRSMSCFKPSQPH